VIHALAAADGSADILLQYGVLGVVVLALGPAVWWFVRKQGERADRLEAENTRLNTRLQEDTLPALILATQAMKASAEVLAQLQRERDIEREIQRRRAEGTP
jgi:hypothetical protein